MKTLKNYKISQTEDGKIIVSESSSWAVPANNLDHAQAILAHKVYCELPEADQEEEAISGLESTEGWLGLS